MLRLPVLAVAPAPPNQPRVRERDAPGPDSDTRRGDRTRRIDAIHHAFQSDDTDRFRSDFPWHDRGVESSGGTALLLSLLAAKTLMAAATIPATATGYRAATRTTNGATLIAAATSIVRRPEWSPVPAAV